MTEVEKVARCHNIKCWPEPFEAMRRGDKTAEFRINDRDYRVGDTLLIREWCPTTGEYTNREIHRSITHILSDGFGLPKGCVMLSLAALDAARGEGADERQAAIVAWLREPERKKFIPMPDTVIPAHWDAEYDVEVPEKRNKMNRLPTARDFADAIESGEWRR